MSTSDTITPVATWVANPRVLANGDSSDASTWTETAQDLANREEYLHNNSALLGSSNAFTNSNSFSDTTEFNAAVDCTAGLEVSGGTFEVGASFNVASATGNMVCGELEANGDVLLDATVGTDFDFNGTTGQISCGQIEATQLVAPIVGVKTYASNPIAINASVGTQLLALNSGMNEIHINKNADADHTLTLQLTAAQLRVGGVYHVALRHYHAGLGSAHHTYVILGTSGAGITARPSSTGHADAIDFPTSAVVATYHTAFFEIRVMSSDGAGNIVAIGKAIGPYSM